MCNLSKSCIQNRRNLSCLPVNLSPCMSICSSVCFYCYSFSIVFLPDVHRPHEVVLSFFNKVFSTSDLLQLYPATFVCFQVIAVVSQVNRLQSGRSNTCTHGHANAVTDKHRYTGIPQERGEETESICLLAVSEGRESRVKRWRQEAPTCS